MKSQLPTYHYFLKDGTANIDSILPNAIGISLSEYHGSDDLVWQEVVNRFWSNPDPLLADLLNIARFIYLVDCHSKRTSWKRNIEVVIPVNRIDIWTDDCVYKELINVLTFASADQWKITFVIRNAPFSASSQSPLIEDYVDYRVCMFSEGLDSLCGIVNRLQNENGKFLAVSALMQHQSHSKIKAAIDELNYLYGQRIIPLQIPFYRRNSKKRNTEEDTHRTRSFLLLSIGAIAALSLKQHRVETFENGIESFNFPLQPSRCPEQLSRAMHPILLNRMSSFISKLTKESFQFSAPFLFDTKADLVKSVYGQVPDTLLLETVSCMHFPQRKLGGNQCGVCTNCVWRRLALASLNISDPFEGKYQIDIYAHNQCNKTFINEDALWQPIYDLNQKVYWLKKALSSPKPFRALLDLSGESWRQDELMEAAACISGLSKEEVEAQLLRLYRKLEWEWQIGHEKIAVLNKQHSEDAEYEVECLV